MDCGAGGPPAAGSPGVYAGPALGLPWSCPASGPGCCPGPGVDAHMGGEGWFRPPTPNSAPHRPRVLRASSWWRCSWAAGKVSRWHAAMPQPSACGCPGVSGSYLQRWAQCLVLTAVPVTLQSSGRCWQRKSFCSTGSETSGRSVCVDTAPGSCWPLPHSETPCPPWWVADPPGQHASPSGPWWVLIGHCYRPP